MLPSKNKSLGLRVLLTDSGHYILPTDNFESSSPELDDQATKISSRVEHYVAQSSPPDQGVLFQIPSDGFQSLHATEDLDDISPDGLLTCPQCQLEANLKTILVCPRCSGRVCVTCISKSGCLPCTTTRYY